MYILMHSVLNGIIGNKRFRQVPQALPTNWCWFNSNYYYPAVTGGLRGYSWRRN